METKIYHNTLKVVRIDLDNGKAVIFRNETSPSGEKVVVEKKYISVDSGTSIPHFVLSEDPRVIARGSIEEVTIMDDQDSDYIHYNNASKPKEVQLPLFDSPVTSGLKDK